RASWWSRVGRPKLAPVLEQEDGEGQQVVAGHRPACRSTRSSSTARTGDSGGNWIVIVACYSDAERRAARPPSAEAHSSHVRPEHGQAQPATTGHGSTTD